MAWNLKVFIFPKTQYTDLHIHKFDIQICSWHDHEDNYWHSLAGHTNLERKHIRSQLFEGAIHRINRYPVDKCWQIKTNRAIRWIVIYTMDNVIHLSNNPGQVIKARRQINMGYWPSLFGRDGWILVSFFFCALMEPRWSQILYWQAWSIKDLLCRKRTLSILLTTAGSQSERRIRVIKLSR